MCSITTSTSLYIPSLPPSPLPSLPPSLPPQVYLNWANHYLRKAGGDQPPLSDLKEIANGQSLPRVLKAVGKVT